MFVAGGESHAAFLEDDVRLSASAAALLTSNGWVPSDEDVVVSLRDVWSTAVDEGDIGELEN